MSVLLVSLTISGQLCAQTAKEELAQLMLDDSTDVNIIAMYPQQVRENIFKVSAHPEGVAKLNDAQKKSNESFRNLISSYSKEQQQKIWNLTRYNNLVSELAATKGKEKRIENVLEKFPAEIHDDALDYAFYHKELIVAIDKANKDFDTQSQIIIANYSMDDQSAFRDMLNTPDAFSLLNKNMHLTVHLGSIYKNDPALLRQQFDSLNIELAEQNAREKEEWKQEMNQNPEAQKEMEQSADQYAKDNGYQQKDYANTDPKVIEHYVYVPYPYWCGYPWWYEYDYWYPYPYWYHYGFYYWNGNVVYLGPPSWYFIRWHFHHHHHFYDYPHITNAYINHYYGPHKNISRNGGEVHSWMNRNENTLPRDFKTNNEQRVDRIREYGKSEIDREKFNEQNPGKIVSRDDFMKQHVEEYPHLKQPVVVVVEQSVPPKINADEENPKQPININSSEKGKSDREGSKPTIPVKQPPVIIKPVPAKPRQVVPVPKTRQEPSRDQKVIPKQIPAKQPSLPQQPNRDQKAPDRK